MDQRRASEVVGYVSEVGGVGVVSHCTGRLVQIVASSSDFGVGGVGGLAAVVAGVSGNSTASSMSARFAVRWLPHDLVSSYLGVARCALTRCELLRAAASRGTAGVQACSTGGGLGVTRVANFPRPPRQPPPEMADAVSKNQSGSTSLASSRANRPSLDVAANVQRLVALQEFGERRRIGRIEYAIDLPLTHGSILDANRARAIPSKFGGGS